MSKVVAPSRPSEHAVSLGGWGWLLLLSRVTGITFGLLFKAVRALLGGRRKSLLFHEYIAYEGMRDYQCGLNAVGIQNLLPSTSKTCVKFAKKRGISHSKIQLPDGTIAVWLGPRKANKAIVFFHGGGYMAPALSEHTSFAFGFAKSPRKDVAVVILQYDLASENANHYPRQLQQAVSLMEHLLHSEEILPSSITLIGDSAGAHLLLSLVLHLNHPNPLVSPLQIDGRLSGAILVSPWVNMDSSSDSMKTNEHRDILSAAALAYWAQNFLGGSSLDPWNSPLTAPTEWWSNLPIDDMLITYGEDELLRDDTARLCEILQSHHAHTTALKFSGELHVHMVVNRFLRINKSCESEKVFVNWLNDHLAVKMHDEPFDTAKDP